MASNKKFIIIFVLLILIVMQNIIGLGITPGRSNLDFSPGIEREFSFNVVNTEHKKMNVAMIVEGDISSYIIIDNKVNSFSSEEESKSFKYKVKLPNTLSPGVHKADIIVQELADDIKDNGMVIKATVSVVTQLYVYVPYPGKYIDVSMDIIKDQKSNVMNFYIPVISRGEEKIDNIKATIEIYMGLDKITSFSTTRVSLGKGERSELSGNWNPESPEGNYLAVAEINYDGQKIKINKTFSIGNESIELLSIGANDFKLGDVAKIKILVQNKLSLDVKDANAFLRIFDSSMEKVADLKSDNYEVPSKSNKEIVIYWDTEKILKGRYSSELKVNYDKKFLLKNFKVDVSDNSILFTGVGFAVADLTGRKTSVMTFVYIIIGILSLINIAWIVYYFRNKAKKKSNKGNIKDVNK